MASRPLSLHDVATQLGVHYMTAYRYVRLGLLEATKRGAHWQVAPPALESFLHRHRPLEARHRPPRRPGWGVGGGPVDWSARYEARLLAADPVGAFAVLEAALVAGAGLEEVYVDVVAPALHRVGARWAAGEIDVADEHVATAAVRQHLGRLSGRLSRRGRSRGTVVVGCPPGERHDVGATVVVALARLAGFDGVDLGGDVPPASLALAVGRADRLVAVGLSLSSPLGAGGLEAAVAAARAAAPGVPVLLGGVGAGGPEEARARGADGHAVDGRQLVRLLDELAPRRRRPPDRPAPGLGDPVRQRVRVGSGEPAVGRGGGPAEAGERPPPG